MPERESPSPRRGRPPKITREQIIDAVLAEGFEGFTVPAVAERLGVTTMTLYRHVATRADLLAMAWGHVVDQRTWPDLDLPWRPLLHDYATALWDLLAEHPGAVAQLSGVVMPARMVHLIDDLAVALINQGFAASDAILAVDSVIDLAVNHRSGMENLAHSVEGDGDTSLHDRISQLWAPGDAGTLPRQEARAAMRQAIASPPRDWFHHKLELVLDGLASRRAADESSHPCGSPRTPTITTAGSGSPRPVDQVPSQAGARATVPRSRPRPPPRGRRAPASTRRARSPADDR